MHATLGRRGLVGLGLAASLALVAGIAVAAIPGNTGVISGCYSKKNGALRVIDAESGASCSASEKPISWNQEGSIAFFHQEPSGPPIVLNPTDGWRTLASLTVPAGFYVVAAKTTVDVVNFVSRSRIDCALLVNGAIKDLAAATVPADSQAVEALNTGVQLPAPGTIALQCRADPTKGMASLYSSSLVATKVGYLESQ